MSLKSERIELRLEAETLGRLDEWRQQQADQPSRSEAIRRLLDVGLELDSRDGFRLNNPDKLLIWMMSEVLKRQLQGSKNAADARDDLRTVDLIQEAIYGGHFWGLVWEMPGVIHNHSDNPRRVREVADILDVWSFIESAYSRLSAESKRLVKAETGWNDPKFHGFDGNNESEYVGIARFFVEKMGRWQSFKGRDFNSHTPTVARYSAMVGAFAPIRRTLDGRELTAKEIVRVLNAPIRK